MKTKTTKFTFCHGVSVVFSGDVPVTVRFLAGQDAEWANQGLAALVDGYEVDWPRRTEGRRTGRVPVIQASPERLARERANLVASRRDDFSGHWAESIDRRIRAIDAILLATA